MIYRYFLAFWILTSSAAAVQSTQYGLLGETVTFRTDIKDPPDDILWKHNGNKVVQFDGNQQTEYNPFQKRITLDWSSADLEINHLTHSDSGQYELDAAKGGGVIRINFELKVLDTVTKPTITCNMRDGSSSDKSGSEATLMCSADPSQSLNYEWSQPGKIQPGQTLTIPLGNEHDDKVYSCTASNRLSKEIATFTAKDCYPGGASAGLITGLVIGGIVTLLCVLGAVFCAVKHKACFAKEEKPEPHFEPLLHGEDPIPPSQELPHLAEQTELDPHTGKSKGLKNSKGTPSTNKPALPKKPSKKTPAEEQKEDFISDQVTEETKGETEKENKEKKSDGMRENEELPTSPAQTVADDKDHLATQTTSTPSMATADENKEPNKVATADQATGGTKEGTKTKNEENQSGDVRKEDEPPTIPGQKVSGLEKNKDEPKKVLQENKDEEPKDSNKNGDGPSAKQPSSPSINKPPVVGEEDNSQQVTGEKQENESVEMTKKEEPPTIPEPTGLENNEGKPEKIGPPVPNKPHLSKVNQGQADVNDDDLQSPTASEKPDGI